MELSILLRKFLDEIRKNKKDKQKNIVERFNQKHDGISIGEFSLSRLKNSENPNDEGLIETILFFLWKEYPSRCPKEVMNDAIFIQLVKEKEEKGEKERQYVYLLYYHSSMNKVERR